MNQTKEVRFDLYCERCIHFEKAEQDDPCNECLTNGFNIDSHMPVCFKEKKGEKND